MKKGNLESSNKVKDSTAKVLKRRAKRPLLKNTEQVLMNTVQASTLKEMITEVKNTKVNRV